MVGEDKDGTQGIEDVTDKKTDERRVLVERLIDKTNPEMITFVLPSEIDDISTMQTVAQDIDAHRKLIDKGTCFLNKFLNNNLVLRTSIQGKRSVQIVDTIHGVMREEVLAGNPLSEISRRILGGGKM
jgi:hypothetical protein